MKLKLFKKLLKRYSENDANEAETRAVDSWYESFGNSHDLDRLTDSAKRRKLRNSMHAEIIKNITPVPVQQFSLFPYLKIAAAIVLIGTVAVLSYQAYRPQALVQSHEIYVSAGAGKMKKLILPDSSELWLNAGSRVHYNSAFTTGKLRIVSLVQGEVFFNVTPNKLKPFIVQTATLKTRVLGTSFNIRSYKETAEIKVTVLTGRVQVSQKDSLLGVLTPGQEITYNKKTAFAHIDAVNAKLSNAWIDGNTYLRQAEFSELVFLFKNRYNIKLKAGSHDVEDYRYSIQLDQHTPIENIVKAICSIHQSKYRRHGDEIVIY